MDLIWLDHISRIVHGVSLITVSGLVAYMIVRDRALIPQTIRTTQWWFVVYIGWHAIVLIANPFVSVTGRVILRSAGAAISVVFAVVIWHHIQKMAKILRGDHDGGT